MSELISTIASKCELLLVPVVAGLAVLVLIASFLAGQVVRELLARKRWSGERRRALSGGADTVSALLAALAHLPSTARRFATEFRSGADASRLRWVRDHVELRGESRLAEIALLIRTGPALGLMGTLIPLGPVLRSVSQGDLSGVSDRLTIAFGTTVAGLLVAVVGFVIGVARRRWDAADVADLDFLLDAREQRDEERKAA